MKQAKFFKSAILAISILTTFYQTVKSQASGYNVSLPPNSTLTLNATAYAFESLELNDGCILNVAPTVPSLQISINNLILKGKSTIDLTAQVAVPATPPAKGTQGQAPNDGHNVPLCGNRGEDGSRGGTGANGVNLNLQINQLNVVQSGSLWIRTDGGRGGDGGNGGGGGKGSSGPQTCVQNPDGGCGGQGGNGGPGGQGGNTSKVVVKVGSNIIAPTSSGGTAPTSRPPESSILGGIIVFGAPGAGGSGGYPGAGGSGGEGHQSHFPCPTTDSNAGAPGGSGAQGARGAAGAFTN